MFAYYMNHFIIKRKLKYLAVKGSEEYSSFAGAVWLNGMNCGNVSIYE
jgi:hypothetical protein